MMDLGGGSEADGKSASWPEEPGVMIKTEPSGEGLEAHTQLSFRMGMARLYDPFACMGAMAGLTPLRRHVTGVVAALLQRRGVEHKITSGILDCTVSVVAQSRWLHSVQRIIQQGGQHSSRHGTARSVHC